MERWRGGINPHLVGSGGRSLFSATQGVDVCFAGMDSRRSMTTTNACSRPVT